MKRRTNETKMRRHHITFVTLILACAAMLLSSADEAPAEQYIHGDQPFQWNPEAPTHRMRAGQAEDGIPIRFTLSRPGYVTLVIDDHQGKRVRNLISEKFFPAGAHTVWWDGLDETGADFRILGMYDLTRKLVSPGEYSVRGLYRDRIDAVYQMTAYNNGNPPWCLPDGTGRWLADHSAPTGIVYLPPGRPDQNGHVHNKQWHNSGNVMVSGKQPVVLITSKISESGEGVVWARLNGEKIVGCTFGVGGGWCGADFATRDAGKDAIEGTYAYNATGWKNWIDIRSMPANEKVFYREYADEPSATLGGFAVHNGLLAVSLTKQNKVVLYDLKSKADGPTIELESPRGLAFDRGGRLLAVSGARLVRFRMPAAITAESTIPAPDVIVPVGLDAPEQIALDLRGRIYVSDRGNSHDVKVYDANGRLLQTIGTPGGMELGPYDETRMINPMQLTVVGNNQLWVAEACGSPKRISIWRTNGKFLKALYGPPGYGYGGSIDPRDKSRFYFLNYGSPTLEFELDHDAGTSKPKAFIYIPNEDSIDMGNGWGPGPQRAIYLDGRQYMTADMTTGPGAQTVSGLWIMRDGIAHPVAVVGGASGWKEFEKNPELKALLPEGVHPNNVLFAWSDRNDDQAIQPEEISLRVGDEPRHYNGFSVGSISYDEDLSVLTSYMLRIRPSGFSPGGAPVFDLSVASKEGSPVFIWSPYGSLAADEGWTIQQASPCTGFLHGEAMWTYPTQWPELHAALHENPPTPAPGQMIGNMRFLGPPIDIPGPEAGQIFAFNGYHGQLYFLTTDGLFVTTLFKDCRTMGYFNAFAILGPARKGLVMNEASLQAECFFDTLTQTEEGEVFLQAGKSFCGIIKIEGLDSIRRMPAMPLQVSAEELARAELAMRTHALQQREEMEPLSVAVRPVAPTVDGKLEDWESAEWAAIAPREGIRSPNSRSTRDKADAAVAVAGDRLYVAFKTNDGNLLQAPGEDPARLFHTGGAVDIQVGAVRLNDEVKSDEPRPGDMRLVATLVEDKPTAILYEPAGHGDSEIFDSGWRQTTIGRVEDVSGQVTMAREGGNIELSIPLQTLGLTGRPGLIVPADLGIIPRVQDQFKNPSPQPTYWRNKACGYAEDVAGGAELHPVMWGKWEFTEAK